YQFLKEDAAYFRNLENRKLTENLLSKHNYTNGHLEILSELFLAEAELANSKGDSERSLNYYQKSRILLEFVMDETKTFSIEKNQKLEVLKNKIANLEIMDD
ncbi:MAG: hypothetical protein ACP5E3_06935, partial [Bacteroidales bacterium]